MWHEFALNYLYVVPFEKLVELMGVSETARFSDNRGPLWQSPGTPLLTLSFFISTRIANRHLTGAWTSSTYEYGSQTSVVQSCTRMRHGGRLAAVDLTWVLHCTAVVYLYYVVHVPL